MPSPSIGSFKGNGVGGTLSTSITTAAAWSSWEGNPIVVICNAATPTGISDTLNNVWVDDGNGVYHCVASKGNGAGGGASNQITVTFASQSYVTLSSWEIANAPAGTLYFEQNLGKLDSGTGVTYLDTAAFSTVNLNAFVALIGSNAAAQLATARNDTIDDTSVYGEYENGGHAFFSSQQTGITVGMGFASSSETYLQAASFGWAANAIRGNCGIGGATVTFTGANTGSVTADVSGNYTTSLLYEGSTTITPTKTGITFTPSSSTQSISSATTDVVINFSAAMTSPSITGLVYTVTDSTIVATWTTPVACDSNIFAGIKSGLDNGLVISESSHTAIVTGLLPSTIYSCYVESLGYSSSLQNVTTAPAQARIAVTGSTQGSITQVSSNGGDTFRTFVSNDNKTYITEDDGYGFGGSANAGYATQICALSNDTTFAGGTTLLNTYGALAEEDGTDGPAADAMTNKSSGLIGLNGNLYMAVYRQYPPTYTSNRYGNIIKSPDHGATWNNFTALSTFVSGGNPVTPHSPSEPVQFYDNLVSLVDFVVYDADDGTLGYNTAGNQIDGGNGYIYMPFCHDAAGTYLMRLPRRSFDSQTLTGLQYWKGPTSPTPADFVNDANWSSSYSSLTNILGSTGAGTGAAWAHIVFVPTLNQYLFAYETQNGGSTADRTTELYSAPTPAGPWTLYYSHEYTTQGYYGHFPMHRDVIGNTAQNNVPIRMVYGGDWQQSSLYKPTVSTFTLTASAWNIIGNAGIAGATVSYSGGSVTADALGYYTIPGLANGSYTITPSKTGYTFSPTSASETVNGADITGVTFTASANSSGNLFIPTAFSLELCWLNKPTSHL
jgi:hypothetical protein